VASAEGFPLVGLASATDLRCRRFVNRTGPAVLWSRVAGRLSPCLVEELAAPPTADICLARVHNRGSGEARWSLQNGEPRFAKRPFNGLGPCALLRTSTAGGGLPLHPSY
jgi:hypothetical protein